MASSLGGRSLLSQGLPGRPAPIAVTTLCLATPPLSHSSLSWARAWASHLPLPAVILWAPWAAQASEHWGPWSTPAPHL